MSVVADSSSTDPRINPYQRPTGTKTYFQAIWDTINLTDFGLEIYYALKFFFDYFRGKPGTHGTSTKLQKMFVTLNSTSAVDQADKDFDRFMPHTIGNGGVPMGKLSPEVRMASNGTAMPGTQRTPSYQRLAEEARVQRDETYAAPRTFRLDASYADPRGPTARSNYPGSSPEQAGYGPTVYTNPAPYSAQPLYTLHPKQPDPMNNRNSMLEILSTHSVGRFFRPTGGMHWQPRRRDIGVQRNDRAVLSISE